MNLAKRTLQVLVSLVVLSAAIAAYLALTFDAARVKAELAQAVLKHTGRTLTIGGDLDLSFFPQLGVRLTDVRLSARNDPAAAFASLRRARAALAVLPLLSRRFVIEHVELDGLEILVRRDAQGRLNVDDLVGGPEKPSGAAGEANQVPRFEIAGLAVQGGEVVFEDMARRSRIVLSELTLETGRLANQSEGKFRFGGALRAGDDVMTARVSAGYRIDLDQRAVAVADVDVRLDGRTAAGAAIDARLAAASLGVQADQLRAESLSLEVDARAEAGRGSLRARASALAGDLAAQTLHLPGYALVVDAAFPDRAPLKVSLDGGVSDLSATTAQGRGKLGLDGAAGEISWSIERFSPLVARADLQLDRLDLDRFRSTASATAGAGDAGTTASPIDLSVLRGPEIRGVVSVGALTVHGLNASDTQIEYWLHKGRLDLPNLRAALYGGRLQGRASIDSHGNRVTLAPSLTGINIHPLLHDLAGKDIIEGRGDVNLDLATAGATTDDMARALSGVASVRLRDGAIRGINLGQTLRALRTAFSARESADQAAAGDQKTDFTSLSASFQIVDGVAHNEDLDGRMPLFRLSGRGDVDLGRRRIDYLAKVTLVNTASGQGGKDLAHLRGVAVPIRLHGSFAQPAYRIEFADLGAAAVKEKLREQVSGGKDKALGDQLKRLFGR